MLQMVGKCRVQVFFSVGQSQCDLQSGHVLRRKDKVDIAIANKRTDEDSEIVTGAVKAPEPKYELKMTHQTEIAFQPAIVFPEGKSTKKRILSAVEHRAYQRGADF